MGNFHGLPESSSQAFAWKSRYSQFVLWGARNLNEKHEYFIVYYTLYLHLEDVSFDYVLFVFVVLAITLLMSSDIPQVAKLFQQQTFLFFALSGESNEFWMFLVACFDDPRINSSNLSSKLPVSS